MLQLLEQSWDRVQGDLRERVGSASYESWLKSLRPVLLERGTVYFEAEHRLAADRVRALFATTLREVLSRDFGVDLKVEIQAPETARFDALEVSPQQPVVDDGNRTAFLVLQSLLPQRGASPSGGGIDGRTGKSAVADRSGRLVAASHYFFHGPSGVGKTFLLKWWRELLPLRALWFDLPGLLRAFQAAHYGDAGLAADDVGDAASPARTRALAGSEQRVDKLRDELCSDLPLVLDEVHRVARKPRLQAFLLQVMRRREALGSPTVLASRWHPKDIRDLDPSLMSVWMSGFVAAIEPPGPVGRLRYLRALEGKPSRNGRAPQVEALAQATSGGYPALRAAWAASRGHALPKRYLELIDPARVFQRCRDRVAAHFGVTVDELVGKGQARALSRARKILALMCQQQGLSGGEIGRFLGRTRAAVSYMLLSLQRELEKSPELRAMVEELT